MTKSTAEMIDDVARHIAEKVIEDTGLTAGEKIKGFLSLIDYLKISAKDDKAAEPETEAFDAIRDRINSIGGENWHPLAPVTGNGHDPASET